MIDLNPARADYLDMLRVYAALRAADPDGVDLGEPTPAKQSLDAEVAAIFGKAALDPDALAREFNLASETMPEDLESLWEAETWERGTYGDEALELLIGELAVSLDPLLDGDPASFDQIEETALNAIFYIDTRIQPHLSVLETVIYQRLRWGLIGPVYAVLVTFAFVIGGIVLAYFHRAEAPRPPDRGGSAGARARPARRPKRRSRRRLRS